MNTEQVFVGWRKALRQRAHSQADVVSMGEYSAWPYLEYESYHNELVRRSARAAIVQHVVADWHYATLLERGIDESVLELAAVLYDEWWALPRWGPNRKRQLNTQAAAHRSLSVAGQIVV